MKKITWSQPLELDLPHGSIHAITGPREALDCLAELWPNHRGPHYVAARSVCRAAIDGRKSPEQAREFFVIAAREAHLKLH